MEVDGFMVLKKINHEVGVIMQFSSCSTYVVRDTQQQLLPLNLVLSLLFYR